MMKTLTLVLIAASSVTARAAGDTDSIGAVLVPSDSAQQACATGIPYTSPGGITPGLAPADAVCAQLGYGPVGSNGRSATADQRAQKAQTLCGEAIEKAQTAIDQFFSNKELCNGKAPFSQLEKEVARLDRFNAEATKLCNEASEYAMRGDNSGLMYLASGRKTGIASIKQKLATDLKSCSNLQQEYKELSAVPVHTSKAGAKFTRYYPSGWRETMFLGTAYRDPSGLIWGSVVTFSDHGEDRIALATAESSKENCASIGARLPNEGDIENLVKFLGKGTTKEYFTEGYSPFTNQHNDKIDVIPGLSENWIWFTSKDNSGKEVVKIFRGSQSEVQDVFSDGQAYLCVKDKE